jgi:hypothetical protein
LQWTTVVGRGVIGICISLFTILLCIMSAKKVLVALAAGILSQCAVASFRLRETSLDLDQMLLKTDNSVNPDGHHGPKRLAGFFKLNRTEVSATS